MATRKPQVPIYANNPLLKGLVFDAQLFEKGGLKAIDLISRVQGVLTNGPTWPRGRFGPEINFDGSNDVITFNSVTLQNSLTQISVEVMFYVKASSANDQRMIHKGTSTDTVKRFTLNVDTAGTSLEFQTAFSVNDGDWLLSGLSLNTLYHAIVTYDFGSLLNDPTFYVNGVQRLHTSKPGTPVGTAPTDGTKIDLGNRSFDVARGLNGNLLYARYWNRILNKQEVQTLYTDPWILYRKPKTIFVLNSGTAFTKSLNEVLTITPTLKKQAARLLSQTLTITPTLKKQNSRLLTQILTLTPTLKKQDARLLKEAVSLTPSFSSIKTKNSTLTQTITLTSSMIRSISRTLTQTITLTPVFTGLRIKFGNFNQTITLTATMTRTIQRTLTQTITLTATATKSFARTFLEYINVLDARNVYQQLFGAASLPTGWTEFGNSTWVYDGATATQNVVGSADPNKVIFTGTTFLSQNRIVQATIKFNAVGTGDSDDRTGLTVIGRLSDGTGVNLLLRGGTELWFLDDGTAWSDGFNYAFPSPPQSGETWNFKALYDGVAYKGKAWKVGTPEPDWQIIWVRSPNTAMLYSGITGNGGSKTTKASFDNFYIYSTTPAFSLSRTLAELIHLTDSITKLHIYGKTLTETLTLVTSMIRSISRTIKETLTITPTLISFAGKKASLNEAITLTASMVKKPGKLLTETIHLTGSMIRSISRTLKNTLTLTASVVSGISYGRILTETIHLTTAFAHSSGKFFAETIQITAKFKAYLNGVSYVWTKTRKILTGVWRKIAKPRNS